MISKNRSWQKPALISLLALLPLLIVFSYALFSSKKTASSDNNVSGDATEVDWKKLRELDLKTGEISESLKNLNGKRVKIPGFMVPLEDNQQQVSEFLLVPNPQACIHVPPPPANQMVLVKMAGNSKSKMAFGPIWVFGTLQISDVNHFYGTSSFSLQGESTESYQYQ